MAYLVSYVATGVVFLALDSLWLSRMAGALYRPKLGPLLAETVNLPPAVLFYALYIAGVVVFAVQPALASGRWTTALALGALFGLVAYGTYDLTNHATLRDWPVIVTVADMAWGTALTAIAATAGMLVAQRAVGWLNG